LLFFKRTVHEYLCVFPALRRSIIITARRDEENACERKEDEKRKNPHPYSDTGGDKLLFPTVACADPLAAGFGL
jgi:hypothetical protein